MIGKGKNSSDERRIYRACNVIGIASLKTINKQSSNHTNTSN